MRYELVETYCIRGEVKTCVSIVSRREYRKRLAKHGIDIDVGGVSHFEDSGVSFHVEHWPQEWVWSPGKQAFVRPDDSFC